MAPKYGTIEYFELQSLNDKLRSRTWNKFNLTSLDKLRNEIEFEIKLSIEKYKEDYENLHHNTQETKE